MTERERVDPDPFAQTPRRSDDPDPFAETPLDVDERQAMLTKLAEHMRPRLQSATDQERELLRQKWEQLRDQSTVEAFKAAAEDLLAALDKVGRGDLAPPAQPQGLGYLNEASKTVRFSDSNRSVLDNLPKANWGD